ncbi:glycosyl transferase family protein [Leptolyngbya sp. Heron Island J]|uniref:ArnT family glycosyltransferase n=1 Tax=Leptolyngbya sp. Heron Island J TaxID=1385935 RepID=UPI0003B9BC02|nr:glycosyl transferase family protein [Leptolyngbya sp. Heron Island J]ESA33408.1 glycosyl transferase family protein [Leptolyngbya sp. Heron Island J]
MPNSPRHRFYLRRTITLAESPQGGWLRFSADNDFVLYVNGRAIGEEYSYFGRIPRNSLGLGKYFSETTQTLGEIAPYDLRTGDIIQASYTRDWKLTGYFDLTRYLKPGKNVIALEVQASHLHPRLLAEGRIYPTLDTTTPISLNTGSTDWQLSPLPTNRQKLKWFDVEFPDHDWQRPKKLVVEETTYSRVSLHTVDRLLQGQWITGKETDHDEVYLQRQWMLSSSPHRAFVRLAGDGPFSVVVNEHLIHQVDTDDADRLSVYEITRLLHPGINTLSARLVKPLAPEWISEQDRPLSFFLDGWVENRQGQIESEIATDETWQSLLSIEDINDSIHQASIVQTPIRHIFNRDYQGDATQAHIGQYLVLQGLWMGGGVLIALVLAWSIGHWLRQQTAFGPDRSDQSKPMLLGLGVLTPGCLFLCIVGLLKHRYAEAERGIFYTLVGTNQLILLIFICIVILTMIWVCRPRQSTWPYRMTILFLTSWLTCTGLSVLLTSYLPLMLVAAGSLIYYASNTFIQQSLYFDLRYYLQPRAWCVANPKYYYWLLTAILILGFCLRAYDIGFNDLEPDENVSYDAVRGILRSGAPIATSEIWYTRGPFFHYPLALWLKIVGLSPENARMWSVLWAVGTLTMVFVFTRLISGKVWIALVATLVLAIDPWELWYSRNVRFYQQTQFLFLLSYWSYYCGFIQASVQYQGPKRWYQYICCISLACILLTQEVTMTLLPSFTLGALYFYRPYQWRSDWRVLISSFMTSSLFVFNAMVFSIKCLTPLVGLSSMTTGHLKFQVANITFFGTDFFVGFNRMHIIYTLLFLCGWLYFCHKKDGRTLFLFNTVLLNITFVTVLVSLKASRYTYPFYPLFSLLSIYSAFTLAQWFGDRLQQWVGKLLPMKGIAIAATVLLLLGNIEPDRILASYSESLTPRHLEISQYIVDHKQPGDVVISNTPSVHANVLKGADYYVPHRMSFFDAVYLHNGRLIDRWEGRRVLTSNDQLEHVLNRADRVWIQVFHQPQLPRDAELAKFYDTLQTISQPVLDTYGTSLRLWQKNDGILRTSPNRGRDLGTY